MQLSHTVYSAKQDSLKEALLKLWKFKNLIWVFAKRDLQVKYTQTYLGIAWGVFKPLFAMGIYVFFGKLLNWQSGDIPYAVYVLSGLVGWNLFVYVASNGVTAANESTTLIKKIFFPKSVLVLSKALVGVAEAVISLVLLVPFLLFFEVNLTWKIIFVPVFLLYTVICGLSVSFIVAAISIKKRDLLQIIPFFLNAAIWFTPVFLSVQQFPSKVQFLFQVNPIANLIDLWRWSLLNYGEFESVWMVNTGIMIFLSVFSFYYFSIQENKIADFV